MPAITTRRPENFPKEACCWIVQILNTVDTQEFISQIKSFFKLFRNGIYKCIDQSVLPTTRNDHHLNKFSLKTPSNVAELYHFEPVGKEPRFLKQAQEDIHKNSSLADVFKKLEQYYKQTLAPSNTYNYVLLNFQHGISARIVAYCTQTRVFDPDDFTYSVKDKFNVVCDYSPAKKNMGKKAGSKSRRPKAEKVSVKDSKDTFEPKVSKKLHTDESSLQDKEKPSPDASTNTNASSTSKDLLLDPDFWLKSDTIVSPYLQHLIKSMEEKSLTLAQALKQEDLDVLFPARPSILSKDDQETLEGVELAFHKSHVYNKQYTYNLELSLALSTLKQSLETEKRLGLRERLYFRIIAASFDIKKLVAAIMYFYTCHPDLSHQEILQNLPPSCQPREEWVYLIAALELHIEEERLKWFTDDKVKMNSKCADPKIHTQAIKFQSENFWEEALKLFEVRIV